MPYPCRAGITETLLPRPPALFHHRALIFCLLLAVPCSSQAELSNPDSLGLKASQALAGQPLASAPEQVTLAHLLNSTAATHPALLANGYEIRAASEQLAAASRQRWPSLALAMETDPGPKPTASSVNRFLTIEQLLWDGGYNRARIGEADSMTRLTHNKAALSRLDLFLQVIGSWQSFLGAGERLYYAQSALTRLKGYQDQMARRVNAEASPRIDLELSLARVLQTEVEVSTARSAVDISLIRLEQISGLPLRHMSHPGHAELDPTLIDSFAQRLADTDWGKVAEQHPAIEKARLEKENLSYQLAAKKAEQWPQIYARVHSPLGQSSTNAITETSYFLGLRYTPGAGFAGLTEADAAALRVRAQNEQIDAVRRDVLLSLINDREEFFQARTRVDALSRSASVADRVLASYLRQFQGGRKGWQDLLNQARELVQTQYALAEARASLLGAMCRLSLRMGQELPF